MGWREWARVGVVRALDRMPDQWFRRLRSTAAVRSDDSRHGTLTWVVRVARHRRLPEPTFELGGRNGVTLAAADSWMTRILYWEGAAGYEGAEADYWERACRRATKVLDLGANVGYYTVLGALANPSCDYRAFEPHPDTAAVARRNLELNGITNAQVVPAAVVGDPHCETVELSTPVHDRHGLPAQAFVRAGSEGVSELVDREINEVDAVYIGDVIDGVDLIKIDIEGQEAQVLEPVIDHLIATGPVLFVEVRAAHVPRLRQVILDLVDGGYLAFAIGSESLHLLPRQELAAAAPLPRYGSRDLILMKAADAHLA